MLFFEQEVEERGGAPRLIFLISKITPPKKFATF
jgi:hypothetical protein